MTAELPGISDHLAVEKAAAQDRWRDKLDDDNLRSMRTCWPEWDGPKVGMTAQVKSPVVYSITEGEMRYHAGALVVLEAHDGLYWTARVEYGDHCPIAPIYNGHRLRLRMMDIWPPVYELREQRFGEDAR
jgi:hypothetical protein